MGKHSDAMREAMALRGFAVRTQKAYLGWMRRLVKGSGKPADELSDSDIRTFQTPVLTSYVWATATIPLLFWLVDSYHHVVQRKFIWRSLQIMDFLNDQRLHDSFKEGRIVGFAVMDIANRRQRDHPEQRRFIAWPRILVFRTMSILYVGLALLSLAIALLYRG